MYTLLWILVADRSKARIFQRGRPSEGIRLIEKFHHPEGRFKEHELLSDRPGRAFRTADTQRQGYSSPTPPLDQVTRDFSQRLAARLERARSENRFEHLVLVAPPRMLGILRDTLDPRLRQMVIQTLDKDYSYQTELEIIRQLELSLAEIDRAIGLSRAL